MRNAAKPSFRLLWEFVTALSAGSRSKLHQCDGTWTLVEFKTDRTRDRDDLERLLVDGGYSAQAQQYVTAAERLLGQQPRFTLCLLNYGGTVYLHGLGSSDFAVRWKSAIQPSSQRA